MVGLFGHRTSANVTWGGAHRDDGAMEVLASAGQSAGSTAANRATPQHLWAPSDPIRPGGRRVRASTTGGAALRESGDVLNAARALLRLLVLDSLDFEAMSTHLDRGGSVAEVLAGLADQVGARTRLGLHPATWDDTVEAVVWELMLNGRLGEPNES